MAAGEQRAGGGKSARQVREGKSARLSPTTWRWAILLVVAAAPRLWLAFALPNPDGDAYAYLETIERMRVSLVAGTFSLKTPYNFWLPLYQMVCALISALVNHPVYVSKLVTAVCGTGVCALVFLLTRRLTANQTVALAAALVVAVNPLHVLYSAFTLTEVPHALAVMGSLYAAVRGRWTVAAVCAAAAGFIRVESWMLIALLPAMEWVAVRRVSVKRCALLLVAPLLWLIICRAATGDFLAYFHERSRYVNDIRAAYPYLQTLSLARLGRNAYVLIHSANPVVLLGCFVAAGLVLRQSLAGRAQSVGEERPAARWVAVFFFAYLAFFVTAFLSGNQPDIWERYGLIFLAMGTPLAAWACVQVTSERRRLAYVVAAMIVVVCGVEARLQMRGAREMVRLTSARQILANKLQDLYESDAGLRVLCDDAGLAALTLIPPERFIPSTGLPAEPERFLSELGQRGIDYIVCPLDDDRPPLGAFPELKAGAAGDRFQLLVPSFPTDWHGRVYLYRLTRRQ